MNKGILIQNISNSLKLLESEKEYAFRTLITKVSERISFNDALKIENIGVFQLKKEPLPRQERAGLLPSASKEKRTLIYSPPFESLEGDVKSVFLTLDLDDLNITSSDDLNKSFSLSVDQPLMPITKTQTGDETDDSAVQENFDSDLERRISDMVDDGEILKNFDIWEEYLNRNLTAGETDYTYKQEEDLKVDEIPKSEDDLLREEPIKPEITPEEEEKRTVQTESVSELKTESNENTIEQIPIQEKQEDKLAKTVLDDDLKAFEEIAQLESGIESKKDEVTENDSTDTETISKQGLHKDEEDLEKLTKGMMSKKTVDTSSSPNVEESPGKDADNSDSGDELSTLDKLTDIDEDLDENDLDHEKSVFDELEEYLKEDDDNEVAMKQEEENDFREEDEIVDSSDVEEPEPKPEFVDSAPVEEITEPFYRKKWFLISAPILVIIIVGILFLLPTDNDSSSGQIADNQETKADTGIVPPSNVPVQKKESIEESPVASKQQSRTNRTGLYRDIPNDVQAAKQIFYDGEVYMIQVSSWRSSAIAEREVERLRKEGYDAFIYKLFLQSKGSTWNRVRIGYFNTLEEAESFLVKNKF